MISKIIVIKFQFIWYDSMLKVENILHIFDLDCCQLAFNSKTLYSTYPFVQSLRTKTIINYKLVNDKNNLDFFKKRTIKYISRGFDLLVPKDFDESLLNIVDIDNFQYSLPIVDPFLYKINVTEKKDENLNLNIKKLDKYCDDKNEDEFCKNYLKKYLHKKAFENLKIFQM
jgi:hypothetical protein